MSIRAAVRLAWSLWAVAAVLTAAQLMLLSLNWSTQMALHLGTVLVVSAFVGIAILYPALGALIASRHPDNSIGWLLSLFGLGLALWGFSSEYAVFGLLTRPDSVPAALLMAWFQSWLIYLIFPGLIVLLLLLFPSGRPLSRGWWAIAWIGFASSLAAILGIILQPAELVSFSRGGGQLVHFNLANPTGLQALAAISRALGLANGGTVLAMLGSAFALIWRFLRTTGEERQQIKWVAYVAGLLGLTMLLVGVTNSVPPVRWLAGWINLFLLVLLAFGIPAAAAVAILKYRLYDIDLVINRSLVFGAMAAFITAVYVAIVVGLGTLIGTGAKPSLALSILATAIVAVAFEPVRARLQRVANRLVYGKRATPYEVLSQFSDRVASAYSAYEILPRMAQVLAEGTGSTRAGIWLQVGGELVPAASWPEVDGAAGDGGERVVPVRHQGELLGELRISKGSGEPLTPVEEKLLSDLAAQAGLVLRNVRLTAELQARLNQISRQAAELRASRQRIVAAQDAERRRLERNIHDGAQQNLVALSVKLRLAATLAKRDPERARQAVTQLERETEQALGTLRDLARGIYPPLLREKGLVEALKVHAPITAGGVGRYDQDIEAAVYFSCLEALQNVAKHAKASAVRVDLRQTDGTLTFVVSDDGVGFDPERTVQGSGLQNMADRVEAVGGDLEVVAAHGSGTTVRGRIPVRAREPVQ